MHCTDGTVAELTSPVGTIGALGLMISSHCLEHPFSSWISLCLDVYMSNYFLFYLLKASWNWNQRLWTKLEERCCISFHYSCYPSRFSGHGESKRKIKQGKPGRSLHTRRNRARDSEAPWSRRYLHLKMLELFEWVKPNMLIYSV